MGSYLAEFLIAKDYEVFGLCRRSSIDNLARLRHINSDRLRIIIGDVTDPACLISVMSTIQPDEIYNLAAQSHVGVSFELPLPTWQVTATGAINVLEAVRLCLRDAKIYQASSSELFGNIPAPQDDLTSFMPLSPYACAKMAAHDYAGVCRDAYGMFVACGIMFNAESPRRPPQFVTRKISQAAARIKMGLQDMLSLGNLEARRDWGFAGDYVEAMWLMLQQEEPGDFIIATGQDHAVQDWLLETFRLAELDIEQHVRIDEALLRPAEVNHLCGDATKTHEELGWAPRIEFEGLVRMMYEADLKEAERELVLHESPR